jgi:hypothetical protein
MKIWKAPSKVGYLSKIAEILNTDLTAQSAQNQKGTRLIWVFIALEMYNFGGTVNLL